MQILTSKLFENQLKDILELLKEDDYQVSKQFKMYLDSIVIEMPTKLKEYKPSIYFDDENVKDIEFEEYAIPFLIDASKSCYIVLGIIKRD